MARHVIFQEESLPPPPLVYPAIYLVAPPGDPGNLEIYVTGSDGSVRKASGGSASGRYLSDQDGLTHYTGKAPSGSGTGDPVWDIRKTVFVADGTVSSSTSASGVKWDDRTTLDYD